jgi:hypothetical protein
VDRYLRLYSYFVDAMQPLYSHVYLAVQPFCTRRLDNNVAMAKQLCCKGYSTTMLQRQRLCSHVTGTNGFSWHFLDMKDCQRNITYIINNNSTKVPGDAANLIVNLRRLNVKERKLVEYFLICQWFF